jgi:acyl-CoA thioesterase-2
MSLLSSLIEKLDIEEKEENKFTGKNLDIGSPQVYGGHVVAQAIVAAYRSVDAKKSLHSLHSYFLHPGNNALDIEYEVETVKNGRSFDVRRVYAKQNEKIIFLLAASFHIEEKGFEHQALMSNITVPEKLNSFPEMFEEFAEKFNIKPRGIFSKESPIIFHPRDHYNPFKPGIRPARNHTWFKANGQAPEKMETQLALLAYASDFNLLITSLMPHNVSLFTSKMQIASLDHAMWIHRKPNLNDWLLYTVESPNSGNARGFCLGRIYSRDGNLIASVAQEGLIRQL